MYEAFRNQVERATPRGDTALWDAISLASAKLVAFAKTHNNCSKRIIVLTDGEDTKSKNQPSVVANFLQKNSIIMDSVCVQIRKCNDKSDTRLCLFSQKKSDWRCSCFSSFNVEGVVEMYWRIFICSHQAQECVEDF